MALALLDSWPPGVSGWWRHRAHLVVIGVAPETDQLDAIRAARAVVMGGSIATPRSDGDRDALRLLVTTRQGIVEARTKAINQLHAAVVTAPEPLRGELRDLSRGQLVKRLSHLRPRPTLPRGVSVALTTLARHIQSLDHHEASLKTEINQLTTKLAPQLLNQHGIGPITAAHILIAWSHKGRIRSEAAFAMLAGVAPIPASSGHTTRHRINHGGDRKLNNALHMIATTRLRDPQTKAYINRKQREGKTKKDAIRSLKRYIARNVYRLLEHAPQPT